MMIARFQIEARFGHKDTVLEMSRRWAEEVGAKVGMNLSKTRILTGSVGVCESVVVMESEISDLGELQATWDKMAKLDAHKKFAKDLEPHVVSGSNRWEVYRVL